jgi:ketosteroid isomerase-like protein
VEHPNVERLREYLDAYAARDPEALSRFFADDAVWHVGGAHRLSGDYRGREAILDYFRAVGGETDQTLRLEPLELMANDRRAAAFLRVTGERAGRRLDIVMAEAIEFDESGRIREFWAHANDQAAVDRFWA